MPGNRSLVGVAALALLCACTPPRAKYVTCPDLDVDGWHWVGVVGPPRAADPGAGVELRYRGQAFASALATSNGSFAVRGGIPVPPLEGDVTLVEVQPSGAVVALGAIMPGPSRAVIAYTPGTWPVYEKPPGTVDFDGRLDMVSGSTTPSAVWIASWTTGNVASVPRGVRLGTEFVAQLTPGHAGECITVVSRHLDGTGGCWWPHGGGCICHHCARDDVAAGVCVDEPPPPAPCMCSPGGPLPAHERSSGDGGGAGFDAGGDGVDGGRTPLPAHEHHGEQPPDPETPGAIPVGDTPVPDAGPPDLGAPDLDADVDLASGEFAPDLGDVDSGAPDPADAGVP